MLHGLIRIALETQAVGGGGLRRLMLHTSDWLRGSSMLALRFAAVKEPPSRLSVCAARDPGVQLVQLLVQMALEAHGGSFPCFSGGAAAVMDGLQQVSTPAHTRPTCTPNPYLTSLSDAKRVCSIPCGQHAPDSVLMACWFGVGSGSGRT